MSNNSHNNKHIPWWVNAVSGAVQATVVTAVGYPFDFVKARMQTKNHRSSWRCILDVFRHEGSLAFYRGSAMPWVSHMFKRPIQYPVSEWMKARLSETGMSGYGYNYLIGGSTGLIGPFFGTPLQVVKVGVQTSATGNTLDYIEQTWSRFGLKGFYRGFLTTCWKDFIFGASFVGNYYTFRDIFGCSEWYQNFFNGAAAHCITWFLFMPIDWVKTHIQRSEEKLTIRRALMNGYKTGGVTIFWRGVIPACARTIPVSGAGMVGFEWVRQGLSEGVVSKN